MKQYLNFKNFYTEVLLAFVDAKCQFIWKTLGAPGNSHDSMHFQSIHLFNEIKEGNALPKKFQLIGKTKNSFHDSWRWCISNKTLDV